MPDHDQKLAPADASDIAVSVAFALLFSGKKRIHNSDRMTANIAAQRIVRHLREMRIRPDEAASDRRIGTIKSARELASYEARGYEVNDRTAELEAAVRAQDTANRRGATVVEGVCGNQARASRRRH